MKSIGKFKIIKQKPKANVVYPMVRLPQSHAHLAGEVAYVFESEHNGKPLFLITLDEDFDGNAVVQPSTSSDVETRLSALEQKIIELEKPPCSDSEKPDGPGEIRTPDLCRVKATS